MPFLGFNLNNECYGSSSFDSYSAKDKQQLQIILFYRCSTCMVNSAIGMLLPEWRTLAWSYLLDDCPYFLELSAIGTVTFACLIYRQVSIDHRWGSATVTYHSRSYCHMRNHQNMFFYNYNIKKTLKKVLNVLRQHQNLQIRLLVPMVAILNLVALSL